MAHLSRWEDTYALELDDGRALVLHTVQDIQASVFFVMYTEMALNRPFSTRKKLQL